MTAQPNRSPSLSLPKAILLNALVLTSLIFSTSLFAAAQSSTPLYETTCFDYNGLPYPNNTQCPGSAMCCGPLDQCIPDRLCQRISDPETMVVGPCSVWPWNGACSQICLYGKSKWLDYLHRNYAADGLEVLLDILVFSPHSCSRGGSWL